jgi:CheY-like chemotaxis protein
VRGIVRDLKLFSRVEQHRPRPVDVRAAIEAAAGMATNEVRHRARLVLDLAPVMPVWGDEGRLAQLFLNLLVNAAQAIPEGAAHEHEIRVTARLAEGDWAGIEVTDTGKGIAPEHVAKIFDPFFTTKPEGVGTGLGLSICQGIVSDLGGRMEVTSAPGKGTTFRVMLPPSSLAATATRPPPEPARGVAKPKRGSVLAIDDEPLILRVIASLLATEHDVVCEPRADGALDRIRRGERFDAILCDLMMPDVTGMDLYAALLEIAPKQAQLVIFLTGGAFTARARAFLDRVPNATIEKPFDAASLLSRVRQIVG